MPSPQNDDEYFENQEGRYVAEIGTSTDFTGRVMTDGTTGEQSLQKIYSKVPMLPLVPLPSLAITKADINFTMEVKSSDMSKSSTDTSVSATASGGYKGWGFQAKFSVTG